MPRGIYEKKPGYGEIRHFPAACPGAGLLYVLKRDFGRAYVLGDCACFGGINNMRNLFTNEEIMSRYYATESTTPGSVAPHSKELPLLTKVRPVNQVVKVDCYVPGCPPNASAILYALSELLNGRIPVLPGEIMRFD